MKRALAGLALSALITTAPSRAAVPPAGFVIEQPNTAPAPPLGAEDMQRLAAGKPPRVFSKTGPGGNWNDGFVRYRCGNCVYVHSSTPELQVCFRQQTPFTIAALVGLSENQGVRVLRGPDGAIQQAATAVTCCFVSSKDKLIMIERYRALDCKVAADGSMEVLPGAVCMGRLEVREISATATPQTRTFESRYICPEQGPQVLNLLVTELVETEARTQALFCSYAGDKTVPKAMVQRELLQRVGLKDGAGYRQIIKNEKPNSAGVMELVHHVIETWRVEKDGSRSMVDRQVLNQPPGAEDAGETH
ncbi:MAG: hypothetical protein WCO57_04065 [Verrucomicrobiota bacterium]